MLTQVVFQFFFSFLSFVSFPNACRFRSGGNGLCLINYYYYYYFDYFAEPSSLMFDRTLIAFTYANKAMGSNCGESEKR